MTFIAALLLAFAPPPAEIAPPAPPVPLPPIVIPPPAPIHGLVVDEDGKAVEGAEVFLTGMPEGFRALDWTAWKGRSDAQGRFSADRSRAWEAGLSLLASTEGIVVYRPGSRLAGVLIGMQSKTSAANPLRIILRTALASSLSLRVVGPDGTQTAGAKIFVRGITGRAFWPGELGERLSVLSGADGRASFTAYPPEDIRGFGIESKEFGSQRIPFAPAATGERLITLQAVGRLAGRIVVNPPGKATVMIARGLTMPRQTTVGSSIGSFEVTTHADGRFEVPALAAGSLVLLSANRPAELYEDRSMRKPVAVVAGKVAEVEIAMKTGIPFRGMLRDRESLRPIEGATVSLISGDDGIRVRTDRSGLFKGFTLPGEVKLSLGHAGPFVLVKGCQLSLGEATANGGVVNAGVVEVVQGSELRGVVRNELNKPLAGAEIAWTGLDGKVVYLGPLGARPVSDAKGEIVVEGLPPGVPIEVTARLGEAATASPTVVTPGQTKDLSLTVSPANTVSLGGRVVDEYGQPIAGALVRVKSRWKTSTGAEVIEPSVLIFGTERIVTDAEGRFQVPRKLQRHAHHQAKAFAQGRFGGPTDWFASTTPSFFVLTLYSDFPAEQKPIRDDYDAGWAAYNAGDYAEAESKFTSALKRAEELKITDKLALAWWHSSLRLAHAKRRQFADAEREARIVLELRGMELPPNHFDLGYAIKELADACMGQRRFDDAAESYVMASPSWSEA